MVCRLIFLTRSTRRSGVQQIQNAVPIRHQLSFEAVRSPLIAVAFPACQASSRQELAVFRMASRGCEIAGDRTGLVGQHRSIANMALAGR